MGSQEDVNIHNRTEAGPLAPNHAQDFPMVSTPSNMGVEALIAFGDESIVSTENPMFRTYVLVAVLCPPVTLGDRDFLRRLNSKRQTKLHWHKESHRSRIMLAESVTRLAWTSVMISLRGPLQMNSERQRRLCLIQLISELHHAGCKDLTLESRGRGLDRNDVSLAVANARRAQQPLALRVAHEQGWKEPLLWIPDIICGAFNMAARGELRAWDLLEHRVTHIALNPKGQPLRR